VEISPAIVLYGGPDQLLPLTSGLAAVFAFGLLFWNKLVVTLGRLVNLFSRNRRRASQHANGTILPSIAQRHGKKSPR